MKSIYLIVLFTVLYVFSYAQSINLSASIGIIETGYSKKSSYSGTADNKKISSFPFAINALYSFKHNEIGVGLQTQSIIFNGENSYKINYAKNAIIIYALTNHTIDLKVIGIYIGLKAGYLMNGNKNGAYEGNNINIPVSGMIIGGQTGIRYRITNKMNIQGELQLNYLPLKMNDSKFISSTSIDNISSFISYGILVGVTYALR